ncbi:MAG: hypothetical protein ACW98X_10110 [Promethearchaeota archaeon]|jgi:predicted RNase H-like nuclease (RuvC/YqgF family)
MADTKDPTLIEYENIIEQLMEENETLKKQITELKEQNDLLKHTEYSFKEPSTPKVKEEQPIPEVKEVYPTPKAKVDPLTPEVQKETKKPLKLSRKAKKKEKLESLEPKQKEFDLEISSDFETPSVPLSTTHKTIIDGHSRRMCPTCDNTRHQFIYEETDKTHILMDYPRIYGKKYKCGKCGQEWRVPVSLE